MEHQHTWVSASLYNRENIPLLTAASAWKPRGTKDLEPAGDGGGLNRKEQSSRAMGWLLGKEAEQAGVAPGRGTTWGGWKCRLQEAGGTGWTRTEGTLDEETEWKWQAGHNGGL